MNGDCDSLRSWRLQKWKTSRIKRGFVTFSQQCYTVWFRYVDMLLYAPGNRPGVLTLQGRGGAVSSRSHWGWSPRPSHSQFSPIPPPLTFLHRFGRRRIGASRKKRISQQLHHLQLNTKLDTLTESDAKWRSHIEVSVLVEWKINVSRSANAPNNRHLQE